MNLNQVTLPATDVAEATAFYQKMGFRLIVEALPDYVRFECPEGEATFSIHRLERMPDADGVYVYFECSELDKPLSNYRNGTLLSMNCRPTRDGFGEKPG